MGSIRPLDIAYAFTSVLAVAVVSGHDPASSLLVQQALREAQASLQRGEPGTAVRVLERQLPYINGNAVYLELLSQAYESYLLELHQLGRTDLLKTYLERLEILNPSRAEALREQWQIGSNPRSSHRMVARGRLDDDGLPGSVSPSDLLPLADQAFLQGHYEQARLLYWRAHHSRQRLSAMQRQRWAYATWQQIYLLLQKPAGPMIYWPVVYQEALQVIEWAPDWQFAQRLLQELQGKALSYRLNVQHDPQRHGDWQVAQSPHFRIYHQQANLADQVLSLAEQTLCVNIWFWFGELVPPTWGTPCEIYLHPDGQAFARATGVAASVEGFSTLMHDAHHAGRVLARRIDLNAQAPGLLPRLVPHETTHVALAGRFGPHPLPRWADEGLALLAEPPETRQFYRDQARLALLQGTALPIQTLITLEDYPPHFQPTTFYGQSLLLVEYLSEHGGKWTLVNFINEVRRLGYEPAVRRWYGLDSLEELAQNAWRRQVAAGQGQAAHLALPLARPHKFTATTHPVDNGWNRR